MIQKTRFFVYMKSVPECVWEGPMIYPQRREFFSMQIGTPKVTGAGCEEEFPNFSCLRSCIEFLIYGQRNTLRDYR